MRIQQWFHVFFSLECRYIHKTSYTNIYLFILNVQINVHVENKILWSVRFLFIWKKMNVFLFWNFTFIYIFKWLNYFLYGCFIIRFTFIVFGNNSSLCNKFGYQGEYFMNVTHKWNNRLIFTRNFSLSEFISVRTANFS